jgi:hypothetical protein
VTADESRTDPATPVQIIVPRALLSRLDAFLAMRGMCLYGPLIDGGYMVGAALPDEMPRPDMNASAAVDQYVDAVTMLLPEPPRRRTRTLRKGASRSNIRTATHVTDGDDDQQRF